MSEFSSVSVPSLPRCWLTRCLGRSRWFFLCGAGVILAGCATTEIKSAINQAVASVKSGAPTTARAAPPNPPVQRRTGAEVTPPSRRQSAGAVAPAVAEGAVQTAEISGPPRFTKPLRSATNLRFLDPQEEGWPLAQAQTLPVTLNYMASTKAPSLFCTYRKPGDKDAYRTVQLWKDRRPDLSQSSESDLDGMSGIKRTLTADVAVERCPATWGLALKTIWGDDAMAQLQALARASSVQESAKEAAWQAQQERQAQAAALAWQRDAAAAPAPSAAEEQTLMRQVDREITSLEQNIANLHSKPFDTALRADLGDRIVRLAQLAYLQSKKLQGQGGSRAAFDAWDNGVGGVALMAMVRLERIVHARMNRRVKLAELTSADVGQDEMQSWGYVDMSRFQPARTTLLEFMRLRLAGQTLMDPAFLKKVADDLRRDRPTGDPGRVYYRYRPAEKQPTWMLSPAEQAAQDRGSSVVQGVMDMVGEVGNMTRLIDKVDADIRDSRRAFWSCYATRCNDAGKAFYAYSYAMLTKDQWLFVMPILTPSVLRPGMAFLGNGNVDGGPIEGCPAEVSSLNQALAPAARMYQSNPADAARLVKAVMDGPAYRVWQSCRDRMEYVLRPRFP